MWLDFDLHQQNVSFGKDKTKYMKLKKDKTIKNGNGSYRIHFPTILKAVVDFGIEAHSSNVLGSELI